MRRNEVKRDGCAVVGGYTLHLYCQHPDARPYVCHPVDEFAAETYAGCAREASALGWWISRPDIAGGRAVLCPVHNKQVEP